MPSPAGPVVESVVSDDLMCEIPSDPAAIVIFGASGDLAHRKLIPALYDLAAHACLAPRYFVLGFARTEATDESFRDRAWEFARTSSEVPIEERRWRDFAQCLGYLTGDYQDAESYSRLAARLAEVDRDGGLGGNRLFYLSTPPEMYGPIIEQLGRAGLDRPSSDKSWVRVIIEKPFGRDLESARQLNAAVLRVFDESQVYRIDHYLGKDTVQNLLVLRFGNGIFEPLWNQKYIDHVQITAAEELGVERRGGFYETAGALRDMVQSHVLQLVSMVAMEPPATFEANAVRNEKLKVLQCIRPYDPQAVKEFVVRGQYGPGKLRGTDVPGYRQEPGVSPESRTETFAAAKLVIDNWRWAGVPFYIRTGKRLSRRLTEIAIRFHRAPHVMFRGRNIDANWLAMNIQPEEGISLAFEAKKPGPEMRIRTVTMDFTYRGAFGSASRSAYATLLNDCLRGDATLFDRADNVEAAWTLVNPILETWRDAPASFPNYAAGSWGPREAELLLERDGRRWHSC